MRHRVPSVRRAVAEYADACGVPDPPLEDLKLAVTEAVTNAVVHGFRSSEPGTVTVAMEVTSSNRVTLVVCDDGEGFTPRIDSPGLGLGLPLIASLASAAEVCTPPGQRGTEVRMHFDLRPTS